MLVRCKFLLNMVPALLTRLIAGLHFFKRGIARSDEAGLANVLENPQRQYFFVSKSISNTSCQVIPDRQPILVETDR